MCGDNRCVGADLEATNPRVSLFLPRDWERGIRARVRTCLSLYVCMHLPVLLCACLRGCVPCRDCTVTAPCALSRVRSVFSACPPH